MFDLGKLGSGMGSPDARLKMVQAMMAGNRGNPHWSGGIANMALALAGGKLSGEADAAKADKQKSAKDAMISALGIGPDQAAGYQSLPLDALQKAFVERTAPKDFNAKQMLLEALAKDGKLTDAASAEYGLTQTADQREKTRSERYRHDTASGNVRMQSDTARRGQDVTARGQDIRATTAGRGQDVTMRGQDASAMTARRGQNVTARGQDINYDLGVMRNDTANEGNAIRDRLGTRRNDLTESRDAMANALGTERNDIQRSLGAERNRIGGIRAEANRARAAKDSPSDIIARAMTEALSDGTLSPEESAHISSLRGATARGAITPKDEAKNTEIRAARDALRSRVGVDGDTLEDVMAVNPDLAKVARGAILGGDGDLGEFMGGAVPPPAATEADNPDGTMVSRFINGLMRGGQEPAAPAGPPPGQTSAPQGPAMTDAPEYLGQLPKAENGATDYTQLPVGQRVRGISKTGRDVYVQKNPDGSMNIYSLAGQLIM